MPQDILIWILTGFASLSTLMLSGIWSEVRKISEKVQAAAVEQSRQSARLDTHEKIVDKLACLNGYVCNHGRTK